MILIDVNLLVYSWDSASPKHEGARQWLGGMLSGTVRVGLPWESTMGFLRIVANPRIFERPATIGRAWRQVEEWLGCSNVWISQPNGETGSLTGRFFRVLGGG